MRCSRDKSLRYKCENERKLSSDPKSARVQIPSAKSQVSIAGPETPKLGGYDIIADHIEIYLDKMPQSVARIASVLQEGRNGAIFTSDGEPSGKSGVRLVRLPGTARRG